MDLWCGYVKNEYMNINIEEIAYDHPVLKELTQELDDYLRVRYPESSVHAVNLQENEIEKKYFIIAYADEFPVGCCAIRHINNTVCELKRMYIREKFRGNKLGEKMYQFLEELAKSKNYKSIKLETGYEQPESIVLYKKMGFYEIPKYGEYVHDPHSICFEKVFY